MNTNRRNFIKKATIATAGLGMIYRSSLMAAEPVVETKQGKRIGMLGLDTGHCMAFTQLFNAPDAGDKYRGYKVTAACPKGTELIKEWKDQIPKITEEIKSQGVEIVDSIEELLKKTDVILMTCIDGNRHLELATPVLKSGKSLFIDKPFTASYRDARAIVEAAREYNTPMFSSSSLRYLTGAENVAETVGGIIGVDTYGPASIEPHHPDLFWYGIHGVEILFAVMGAGCKSVRRTYTPETDLVVGMWDDKRLGTFRGTRNGAYGFGATVFGKKNTVHLNKDEGYSPLLVKIAEFYDTKIAPFPVEQTLEIIAFMEAADESKKQGGIEISLESLMIKRC
ncbi:MAG: Gfo/Idh/MocA family oxidoreductase [Prevotellaceae bacterium]|jgi:predicted dehydrogenase|nr:Gfo/Idh/MocA family oxidoreductase [Prevotellaceae bacterium]